MQNHEGKSSNLGTEFINSLYNLLQHKTNAKVEKVNNNIENEVERLKNCNDFRKESSKKTTDVKHVKNIQDYSSLRDRDENYGKRLASKSTKDSIITQNADRFTPYYGEDFYDALDSFRNNVKVSPASSTKLELYSSLPNGKRDKECVHEVAKDDNSIQNSSRFTSYADEFYDALESMASIETEDKEKDITKKKRSTTRQSTIRNQIDGNQICAEKEFCGVDISRNMVDDKHCAKYDLFISPEKMGCVNPKSNRGTTKNACKKKELTRKYRNNKHHLVTSGNLSDLIYDELDKMEMSKGSDSAKAKEYKRSTVGDTYRKDAKNFTGLQKPNDTDSLHKVEVIERGNQSLKERSKDNGDNKKSIFDYLETNNFIQSSNINNKISLKLEESKDNIIKHGGNAKNLINENSCLETTCTSIHDLLDDLDKIRGKKTNSNEESIKCGQDRSRKNDTRIHKLDAENTFIQKMTIPSNSPHTVNTSEKSTIEQITQLVKKLRGYSKEEENSIEEIHEIKKKLVELMQR